MKQTQMKKDKNSNLMSKISEVNFFSLNELEIGTYLDKMRNTIDDKVFSSWIYIEKSCSIQRKQLNSSFEYEKCPKISKQNTKKTKEKEYMLLYTKFVNSIDYSKYLNSDFGIHKIFKLYYYQMSCAKVCIDLGINHQDMHLQNILIDENEDMYLIDFGLTMSYDKCYLDKSNEKLDMNYLKNIFISYQPNWVKLPIEYHICAFFIYKKTMLKDEDLRFIIDSNLDKNEVFLYFEKQRDITKEKIYYYFHSLYANKKNIEDCIKHILKHYFSTWDVYQINFISLLLIRSYLKEHHMIIDYISMCKNGISHNYKIRGTAKKYLNMSSAIFQNYFETSELIYDEDYDYVLNNEQKNTISYKLNNSYLSTYYL